MERVWDTVVGGWISRILSNSLGLGCNPSSDNAKCPKKVTERWARVHFLHPNLRLASSQVTEDHS